MELHDSVKSNIRPRVSGIKNFRDGKLNRFQLKGLRQILRMVTTFIDRSNTNTRVLEEADRAVNGNRRPSQRTPIRILSETHTDARIKLAGKILRLADNDPRRFACYVAGTAKVKKKHKRRSGRPKINWGDVTHCRIWERISEEYSLGEEIGDPLDESQQSWIQAAAHFGYF